jgi:cytochrome c biogenesis protein CcmG, thiol:disulfide interchange protein DsbE
MDIQSRSPICEEIRPSSFFSTAWCPACKEELPHINWLAAEYGAKGVNVLGLDIKEGKARTIGGIKNFGVRYRVACAADAAVARRYDVTGTSTIISLDRHGMTDYFGNELLDDNGMRLDRLLVQQR